MFGRSTKGKPTKLKLDTMIGNNTEITGDINFTDMLAVHGTVRGSVSAEDHQQSHLALYKGGRIIGDVRVADIYIDGEVEGDVYASERVELANNAQIKGNVYYNLLEMAMGAAINGNLVHKPKEEIRLLEHKGDDKGLGLNKKSDNKADAKPDNEPKNGIISGLKDVK